MIEKIKVLRIITRLNIGGPTIHTVLLNARMDPEKYESYLLTGSIESHESDMLYFAQKYRIKPIYIKSMKREIRPLHDLKALWEIYMTVKKIKPYIVHTHTAKAGTLGRIAAKLAHVPIIIHTFHGNVFKGYFGKFKTEYFIFVEKLLTKITNKIIAISKKQKQELISLKIAKPGQITVINLGFDFKNFLPRKSDKNRFRRSFDFTMNSKLIGIIGRLAPIKNHMLFLDIAEQILKKYSNVYFAIIGDGELKKVIKNEIIKRKIDNKVKITGFIKDLRQVYADLDLVLLTSKNEGTPVAIIEAMASKILVMSTKVGGVEDFIDHGINGFYFPISVNSFVGEIEQWLKDNSKYKVIQENACQRAYEKFSSDRLIYEIDKLYFELVVKKGIK